MFLRNWYLFNGPSQLGGYNSSTTKWQCNTKNAPSIRVYNGQTLGDICTNFQDNYTNWYGTTPTIYASTQNQSCPGQEYMSFYIDGCSPLLIGKNLYANTDARKFAIILGEGTPNDSTPVTLDDYSITNQLTDSDISSYTSSMNNANGSISITPILTTNKTIREVGLAKAWAIRTDQTFKTGTTYIQDMENAGFTLNEDNSFGNPYKPLLVLFAKIKLQTPIQLTAGIGKTITIATAPNSMQ